MFQFFFQVDINAATQGKSWLCFYQVTFPLRAIEWIVYNSYDIKHFVLFSYAHKSLNSVLGSYTIIILYLINRIFNLLDFVAIQNKILAFFFKQKIVTIRKIVYFFSLIRQNQCLGS